MVKDEGKQKYSEVASWLNILLALILISISIVIMSGQSITFLRKTSNINATKIAKFIYFIFRL